MLLPSYSWRSAVYGAPECSTGQCACRCGNFVYSGARRDSALLCWDVRYTGECLYRLEGHVSESPQRLAFDIEPCGRLLFAGGTDGNVRVYDLSQGTLERTIKVADDTVGGVSLHPTLPMLLTASGHRRFVDMDSDESSDDSGGAGVRLGKRRRAEPAWQLSARSNEMAVWQLESSVVVETEAVGEAEQHQGAEFADQAPANAGSASQEVVEAKDIPAT